MPYTPINTAVYTSAFSGAIAGMAVSGWITDTTANDYADVVIIAGAFAQSFDQIWNSATQLDNLELAAITQIVQTDFNGRGPGPFANPQLQNPGNWDVAARACVALVLESDIFFASQGINPGTPGGSGPLPITTKELYVQKWGSDITGNGTLNNPYLTISYAQSTILDATSTKIYVIWVGPGTYVENVALKAFTQIVGTNPTQNTQNYLPTLVQGNFTLGPSFSGPPSAQEGWLTNLDIGGTFILDYIGVGGTNPCSVQATNCQFESDVTLIGSFSNSNETEFHHSTFFGNVSTLGGSSVFYECNGVDSGILFLAQAQANNNCSVNCYGGAWAGDVQADQNGTDTAFCLIFSQGWSASRGTTSILATAATSPAILANIGDLPENVTLTGAAATASKQMRVSVQFANFPGGGTILAGTTTNIDNPLPAALVPLFGAPNPIEQWHMVATPQGIQWGALYVGLIDVWFYFWTNTGVPTVTTVLVNNTLTPVIIPVGLLLNVSGYLPTDLPVVNPP